MNRGKEQCLQTRLDPQEETVELRLTEHYEDMMQKHWGCEEEEDYYWL